MLNGYLQLGYEKMSFDIIKELQRQITELKKEVQQISDSLLNIHFNNDLFLKIMRLEQREITRNQRLSRLEETIKLFSKKKLKLNPNSDNNYEMS